jgi:hypothetical protein
MLEANPAWLLVKTDLSSAFQSAAREDIHYELPGTDELRDLHPAVHPSKHHHLHVVVWRFH